MKFGRTKIYTDVPVITSDNVITVLQNAMVIHQTNANRIEYLLNYEAGIQPLQRKKITRQDVDCVCVDNVANEVVEFKEGFHWGNPITLIQNENSTDNKQEAVALLNACYDADKVKSKTQEIGRNVEITALCYTYIDLNDNYVDGDSYFTITPLDPRNSFMVYSNYYIDHRPMMGVTYSVDETGTKHFTCITKDFRFEIVDAIKIVNGKVEDEQWYHNNRSGEKNPFGVINMCEWLRSSDRMGVFERHISDMDTLNIEESDFCNDVVQNTNAIWHSNDVEFPVDENGNEHTPSSGEWAMTFTSKDGRQPFIKALSIPYDYNGMLQNIINKRTTLLQKMNVPQRNSSSGGSTGIAMSDATGWSAAEMSACKQQSFQESAKMDEVRIVLAVIKHSPHLKADSPLRELKPYDVQPNIKRMKTYELTTKVNSIVSLVNIGMELEDIITEIPLFSDPNKVVTNSGEKVKEYQDKKLFQDLKDTTVNKGGSERTTQDYSDQIENSPQIDTSKSDIR